MANINAGEAIQLTESTGYSTLSTEQLHQLHTECAAVHISEVGFWWKQTVFVFILNLNNASTVFTPTKTKEQKKSMDFFLFHTKRSLWMLYSNYFSLMLIIIFCFLLIYTD